MHEATHQYDPRIGSVLQERYRILELLAEGGMGRVYRGERLELGKPVAIKFLHAWAARDEDFRKRFLVEARAMSRLTHPCCVSVIDYGMDQGSPYMVMDFVTGDTLRGLLREGPLPRARVLALLRQLLAGLSHAHEQGIVHRDIKPENVIITHAVGLGEQVRILDFGLAKLKDGVTGITSGMILGTPAYMAPEQIRGEPVGPATDLYATGVMLFELLTGRKPFDASGSAELLRMHREVAPPPLRAQAPEAGFSAELEAVLAQAMAKDPAERFQSAAEFLAALDAAWQAPLPSSEGMVVPASAHDAPTAPQAAYSAPTRVVVDPEAKTESAQAQTPVMPLPLPAEAFGPGGTQARVPTRVASSEALAAAVAASARSDSAVVVPAPQPQAAAPEAPAPSVSVPTPAPVAVPRRSRGLLVGGAAALVLLGAGVLWSVAPAPSPSSPEPARQEASPAPARAPSEAVKRSPPAAPAPAKKEEPWTSAAPAEARRPAPEQLPGIEEAHRLIRARRRDAALAALKKLAAKYPASAYVRFLEGNVDFDNLRWVDGVAAYRAALRNDPAYRHEPTVIQNAIRCLVSDRYHGTCVDFLRKDLGKAAVPYLEEAARADPMANVRVRAAWLLRQHDFQAHVGSRQAP